MTEYEQRSDRFTAVEDQYAGYTVVDEGGSKIGKVDDLFLEYSLRRLTGVGGTTQDGPENHGVPGLYPGPAI